MAETFAPLVWDAAGSRFYESGVQKVALYLYNSTTKAYDSAVVWNGITSVSESPSGADANDLYADNIKYATMRSAEQLGLSIEAYTYPDEFAICDGTASPVDGVYLGQQSRSVFGLSYRTELGNDEGAELDDGYKLHLIYGCTASPSDRGYSTVNDSPDAISFSWEVSTNPVAVTGYKPVSSITIDSRKFKDTSKKALLKALEDKLYGTTAKAAYLPMPTEVLTTLGYTTSQE